MTVAVFGGSFNPPHVGHVLAAAYVLATTDVERLLVVPSFKHPFNKPLAPFDDRIAMCELAMKSLTSVAVSRIEEKTDGLTLHMLEAIREEHPDWTLRLVIGSDILAEADKWFRFDEVRRVAPLIVVARNGFEPPNHELLLPEASSTRVRELLAKREWDALAPVVPRRVLDYIRSRGLYT